MGQGTSSDEWSNEYQVIAENQWNPAHKVVKHRVSNNKFNFLRISLSDEIELQTMMNRLRSRTEVKSPNIVPFEKVYHRKEEEMCGNSLKVEAIYECYDSSLDDHFITRKQARETFSTQEVMHIVQCLCYGLKDLALMKDQHGKVNLKTVVVGSEVMLTDPIVLEGDSNVSKPTKIDGYPSPAVLFNLVDNGMRVDRCKEDLFSVGVLALQLLNPQ